MDFQTRKSLAREAVTLYLDQFTAPRGLDDQQQANRIASIADAFARKMPVKGDYIEAIKAVLVKVSDTHLSNTWPPQAAFVMAMPLGETMGRPAAESYRVGNRADHYGELMRDGETVPEPVIWGPLASQLPKHELDRYRNASVMTWAETYGGAAGKMMANRYGSSVKAYFPEEASA